MKLPVAGLCSVCGVKWSVPSSRDDQSHTGISTYCTTVVLQINTAFHCLVILLSCPTNDHCLRIVSVQCNHSTLLMHLFMFYWSVFKLSSEFKIKP